MSKTYYVSQTEDYYIIYTRADELNIFADKIGKPLNEIEGIGDVYVSNNEIIQTDLECVPLHELLPLLHTIKTMHLYQFETQTISRDKMTDDPILKLSQRLSDLDIANRRKKKALRQADKDLKFLRNTLEGTQRENEYMKALFKLNAQRMEPEIREK